MLKHAQQNKFFVSLCYIIACFLAGIFIILSSSCYLKGHQPGDPGSMSIDNQFSRENTLVNKSLYITFADSKGIFSKRTLENFVYEFSSDNTFNYYQAADHVLVASGNYHYTLSSKNNRLALIRFDNRSGVFSKATLVMQLNFYNTDMGVYKITLLNHAQTNVATGIFKISSTSGRE